jgi:outer membrane protein OmpA-like peptidoglycan-associated protein
MSTMRNNVNKVWRGVIGAAPLSVLVLGGLAMAEPMEGASSEETSAVPVCKDSGVTVNFGIGSSEIDRNGKGALSGVATWVQNGDQRTVHLEGFASKTGGATANQRLSERRAQAAEDFLVGKGVAADRISVVGHGEDTAPVSNADARVVKVKTCDVPRKIAEVMPPLPPPEPVAPPEPVEPTPPPVVIVPPAPAPPPAPMYEPVPPPPAEVVRHDTPASKIGIEALVGGGAVGFIDSAARNTVNTGGSWDVRLTFGSRLPIAIEGAYVGSAQSIEALGLSTNSRLIGNGVEGDLRLNFTNYMVQPYIFGGAGWTHYQITNSATNTSSVLSSDDVGTVPLGAGISIRPAKGFLVDVRGTYRAVFDDTMFDRITNSNNSMQNWSALGRLGFEF